jgi:hypothetical protein
MILHVDPNAPLWMRTGADALLATHIGGGIVGVLSGSVAVIAPKGERVHRLFGTIFFVSMLLMSGVGFVVSFFLNSPTNIMAGLFAFYMVGTAWLTVKRKDGEIGQLEKIAFAVPVVATIAGVTWIIMARNSPTGTIGDAPVEALYGTVAVGLLAAGSDLNVILRGGISGSARIARHLWRMMTGLFVATGSFFLGQQSVMPGFVQGSPVLFVLALFPLPLLLYWLFRVRFTNWFTPRTAAA